MSLEDDWAKAKPVADLSAEWEKATPVSAQDKPQPQRTVGEELGRQAGLGARAVLSGAAAIPLAFGNAGTAAVNYGKRALGMEPSELPSKRFDEALDFFLPKPETGLEKFAQGVISTVAGGGLQIGAANALARNAGPVTQGVLTQLASNPGGQLAALAGGGAASTGTELAGGGPALQMAAGLVGAMIPGSVGLRQRPPGVDARLDNVRALGEQGVQMTPGQITGGSLQRIEDSLTSVPFIGDAIRAAKQRGIESFDRVAINRALEPIGETLPKKMPVGHEAIRYTADRLGTAYDKLLSGMYGELDSQFAADIDKVRDMGQRGLAPQQAGELSRIIDNEIIGRFAPTQGAPGTALTTGAQPTGPLRVAGETIKEIESELGNIARSNQRSENYDVRKVGRAAMELQSALRRMLERVNPDDAKALASINEGYANFLRAQTAAGYKGAKEGVFNANQYDSAVKRRDSSKAGSAYARGEAFGQDLSSPASAILPSTVPDSGTPLRYLVSHPIQAAYGAAAGIPLAALYSGPGTTFAQRLLLGEPRNALVNMMALPNVMAGIQQ